MSANPSRRNFIKRLLGGALAFVVSACRGAATVTARPGETAAPQTRGPAAPGQALDTATPGPLPPPPPTATATPMPPLEYPFPIVRREAWGARPPNHNAPEEHGDFDPAENPFGWEVYAQPLRGFLTTIVVHHSALPVTDGPREIQVLHQDARGWADIGYHFVVGPDGTLYEARDLRVRGRHVGGANTGMVGICLMGNFEEIPEAPAAQLATLEVIAGYLAATYDMHYISGHRDFNPNTLCPGAHLYTHIDALGAQLGLTHSTLGYEPPAWVITLTPEERH